MSEEQIPFVVNLSERLHSAQVPFAVMVGGSGISVQVAKTVNAFEELKPLWASFAQSPDADLDYFLHSIKNDSTVLHPHVIAIYRDGSPQTILLGRVRVCIICTSILFADLPGPRIRMLDFANAGSSDSLAPDVASALAATLFDSIKSGEIDSFCFLRLGLKSQLFANISSFLGIYKARILRGVNYAELTLEGQYPCSTDRHSKQELRRKTRILEGAFPGEVYFRHYVQPDELDIGIRDAVTVLPRTWQHSLGYSHLSTSLVTGDLAFFAAKGWLRVYIAYVQGIPRAFLIGQLYKGRFYCQYAGYDRDFRSFSLGALLTAWAFGELASEGIRHVDLGSGGQEHSARIGARRCEENTVHVYSNTFAGVCGNAFVSLTELARVGVRFAGSVLKRKGFSKFRHTAVLGILEPRFVPEPPGHLSRSSTNRLQIKLKQ